MEKHAGGKGSLEEVPRVQRNPVRPRLKNLFRDRPADAILVAYRDHGYRLKEIAQHLGVHYATVSRRLTKLESRSKDV